MKTNFKVISLFTCSLALPLLCSPPLYADAKVVEDDSFIPLEEPMPIDSKSDNDFEFIDIRPESSTKNLSERSAGGSDCLVDFSDWDAFNILPDYAQYTFAPHWIKKCGYGKWAYIKPPVYKHFHLSYEDQDMQTCQIQGTCSNHDPRDQPRSLFTHRNDEKLILTLYDADGYLPFGIKTIRIIGNKPVKLCFKKRKTPDDFDLASRRSGASGRWACWNRLGTGHWDLSQWVNDVIKVTITGVGDSVPFAIDDIVYRVY